MHSCIHAFMHSYIHAFIHSCIHASMHSCIHAFMHSSHSLSPFLFLFFFSNSSVIPPLISIFLRYKMVSRLFLSSFINNRLFFDDLSIHAFQDVQAYLCIHSKHWEWISSCDSISDPSILATVCICRCNIDQGCSLEGIFVHGNGIIHRVKHRIIVVNVTNLDVNLSLQQLRKKSGFWNAMQLSTCSYLYH